MQKYLKQGEDDGPYQWEMMDGYEDLPDHCQEKLRLAIEAGHIAPEDFRGVSNVFRSM